MRVLILDGHSSAAIEAMQSLGRHGAHVDVACGAEDCIAFRSRYIGERLKQPPLEPLEAATGWLRSLAPAYDLVIPATDVSLLVLRALGEDEPARRKAVLPRNAALDVALDKDATRELGERLGVPVPASELIAQGAAVPPCERYPVVLKSIRSRVLIDGENRRLAAVIARDAAERERVLCRWLPYTSVQQQEYAIGHGFGIEMLFDRGRLAWQFAHERIHEVPLTGGGSSYRRSITPPRSLAAMAERMLAALNWHGVAMVEFRGSRTLGFRLMEINPRLWGSLALAIDCGVDFPWGLALLATGRALPKQPSYRAGYYTRHPCSDLSWQRANLRADRHDPFLLTRPRLVSALELLRPLWGAESWDHFDWRDPALAAAMLAAIARDEAGRLRARLGRSAEQWLALRHHRRVMAEIAARGRPARILFVCYGNICRSPVAAGLARQRLPGVEIASAGFHETQGRSTPAHVRRAAGFALEPHASRRVKLPDVAWADLILCMEPSNLQRLRREFPQAASRATLLGLFANPPLHEIADPDALPEPETRAVVRTIRSAVEGLRAWLDDHFRVTPTSVSGSQVASSGNTVITAIQSTIMKKKGSDASAT
jgi:protein-tyrosine-phosphatase/predicted ATP-grasp superfamily ATP-dependent carboligase